MIQEVIFLAFSHPKGLAFFASWQREKK